MWDVRFWTWLIARLLVAMLLVGGLWWFLMTPDSYEAEFKSSREALKSVKTWKYELVRDHKTDSYQEGSGEVDCDKGVRATFHIHNEIPDHEPFDDSSEWTRFENVTYVKTPAGWKKGSPFWGDPSVACRQIREGAPGQPFPNFDDLFDHYLVTTKDKKEINGVTCRNWLAQLPARPGVHPKREMTLCLGVHDHLPYEISGSDVNHYIFRDFNMPLKIGKPVLAEELNSGMENGS